MKFRNSVLKYSALAVVLSAPVVAFAGGGGGTYAEITDAVDWADAITALGVVAAAFALALVAKKGFKIVLGMIS